MKKNQTCNYCNKTFEGRTRKYCSFNCQRKGRTRRKNCKFCKVEMLATAKHSFCSKKCEKAADDVRAYNYKLHVSRTRDPKCVGCGEQTTYLLCTHHIDGNHENNRTTNFEIVCGNCHIKRHLAKNKFGQWVYNTAELTPRKMLAFL